MQKGTATLIQLIQSDIGIGGWAHFNLQTDLSITNENGNPNRSISNTGPIHIENRQRPHTQDAGARKRTKRILNPNGTILQQASSRTKNLFNQVKMNTVTNNLVVGRELLANEDLANLDTDHKFFALRNMARSQSRKSSKEPTFVPLCKPRKLVKKVKVKA